VQLRTIGQDAWANTVEQRGRAQGVGFKFGEGSADIHDEFRTAAEVIAAFDRSEISRAELRTALEAMP
jgi:ppGpp synthetase/RelA/SpoT-type nucleotidyltranferase